MIDLEAYVGPDRAAAILNEADEAYVHFQQLVDTTHPERSRTAAVSSLPVRGGLPQARKEVRGVPRQWRGSGVTLIQPGDEGFVTRRLPRRDGGAAGLAHPQCSSTAPSPSRGRRSVDPHGHRVTDIDSSVGPHTITVASGSGTARGHRRSLQAMSIATNTPIGSRCGIGNASSRCRRRPDRTIGRERIEALLPAMIAVIDTNRGIVYARPTRMVRGSVRGRVVSVLLTATSARILQIRCSRSSRRSPM